MRVGILTFQFAINYGAVLQMYALQRVLKDRGLDVWIINYLPSVSKSYDLAQISKDLLADIQQKPLRSTARWLRFKLFLEKDYRAKRSRFDMFIRDNLRVTDVLQTHDELCKDSDSYSSVIFGSDQIWNPEITGGFDSAYFGGPFSSTLNRISYAASVGDINCIEAFGRDEFFGLLRNFTSLGVREQGLQEYIYANSDMKPSVNLDPTLLLTPHDYESITASPVVNAPYLLLYTLSPNVTLTRVAQHIDGRLGLQVVSLSGGLFGSQGRSCRTIGDAGPREFLSLFRNANYVMTNSFHGVAFSITFRKDFNCVLNKSRNSRITDLLQLVGLGNRVLIADPTNVSSSPICYGDVDSVLEENRKLSKDYILSALGLHH